QYQLAILPVSVSGKIPRVRKNIRTPYFAFFAIYSGCLRTLREENGSLQENHLAVSESFYTFAPAFLSDIKKRFCLFLVN
ncbi:MAG: hypothetical protein UIG52_00230, partial [Bacteroidales bacterium]|nr:hypothetical protein [Bacteroidales bacterium]